MRKILFSMFLALMVLMSLSACVIDENSMPQRLQKAIDEASTMPLNRYTNLDSVLYDYYLPPSFGRRNASLSSVVLVNQNVEILMNLDVVGILNAQSDLASANVLRSTVNTTQSMIALSGVTSDLKGLDLAYEVSVNELSTNRVLLTLQSESFIFSSILPIALVPETAFEMLRIARSASVQSEAILATYSNKEIINYQKETLDMFAQLAPESGTVVDMIEGEDVNLFDDAYYDAGPIDESVPVE